MGRWSRRVAACAAMLGAVACLGAPPAPLEEPAADCVDSLALATLTSCALMRDGTARCFGFDNYGELGNDSELARSDDPVPVQGLAGIQRIRGGSYGFCAILDDSSAWCWGRNEVDRFGEGNQANRPTPVAVDGLSDVVDIELGGNHACALLDDGSVWCLGGNDFGELGYDSGTAGSATPVEVPIAAATQVEASYGVSCALLAGDLGVACWGHLGGAFSSSVPVEYPLTGVVELSAHGHSVYARRDDGTVWAWGANAQGQLGDGTTTSRPQPVEVSDLTDVIAVAGGGSHACAVRRDGSVWCWGANYFGQLGVPGEGASEVPVRVPGIPAATTIAAGQEHTCVTAVDGTVHCWGHNCCFQLGGGVRSDASAPLRAGVDCPAGD